MKMQEIGARYKYASRFSAVVGIQKTLSWVHALRRRERAGLLWLFHRWKDPQLKTQEPPVCRAKRAREKRHPFVRHNAAVTDSVGLAETAFAHIQKITNGILYRSIKHQKGVSVPPVHQTLTKVGSTRTLVYIQYGTSDVGFRQFSLSKREW